MSLECVQVCTKSCSLNYIAEIRTAIPELIWSEVVLYVNYVHIQGFQL